MRIRISYNMDVMIEHIFESHRQAAPCSIITNESVHGEARIVAATLGGGKFTTHSADILSPEADRYLIATAVGASLPVEGFDAPVHAEVPLFAVARTAELNDEIEAVAGTPLAVAIDWCFSSADSYFKVAQSVSLPPERQLDAREKKVLGLICRGFIIDTVANELKIAPSRSRTHFNSIFRKLQVRSIYAAVTMGHLALQCGELSDT